MTARCGRYKQTEQRRIKKDFTNNGSGEKVDTLS